MCSVIKRGKMDIESKYVSEDYAKEYINIHLEANRLRKNGDFIGTKIIMIE